MPGRGTAGDPDRAGLVLPGAASSMFVGRVRELDRLGGLLTLGHGLVLVTGDAGSGKTRLMAEAQRGRPDLVVLRAECPALTDTEPLHPVIEALEPADPVMLGLVLAAAEQLAPSHRTALATLLTHTFGLSAPGAAGRPVRRAELFAGCHELLAALGATLGSGRLVLLVESAHWADADTLALLSNLTSGRPRAALTVVVTCRSDERPLTTEVRTWLREVRHGGDDVRELRLTPLSREDVARQVRGLLPEAPDSMVGHLVRRGEGNPFLVEQLVAAHRTRGEVGLPRRVADFLWDRVAGCSAEATELMTVLAVAGHPVTPSDLAAVLGTDEPSCLRTVRELASASLVAVEDGRVRPWHSLVGEAWLLHQPPSTRRFRGRLAELLEQSNDDAVAAEAAGQYRRAGRPGDELRMATRAAARARALSSDSDAARWWGRCLALEAEVAGQQPSAGDFQLPAQRESRREGEPEESPEPATPPARPG